MAAWSTATPTQPECEVQTLVLLGSGSSPEYLVLLYSCLPQRPLSQDVDLTTLPVLRV